MNPQLRPIAELLGAERIQYRIPLFQRNYAWEKKRVELFLKYACELADARPSNETNFIGFMVYLAYLSKAKMPQLSRVQRTKRRLWLSVGLAVVYVPYEFWFNVWGTSKFKSTQFVNNPSSPGWSDAAGPPNADSLCKLNSFYQIFGILYMLVIYCQGVIFLMLVCMFLSAVQRFFDITDDIP